MPPVAWRSALTVGQVSPSMQSGPPSRLFCSFAAAVHPSWPPSNVLSTATETLVTADACPASANRAAPDTHPSRQARRMRLLSEVDTMLLPWNVAVCFPPLRRTTPNRSDPPSFLDG